MEEYVIKTIISDEYPQGYIDQCLFDSRERLVRHLAEKFKDGEIYTVQIRQSKGDLRGYKATDVYLSARVGVVNRVPISIYVIPDNPTCDTIVLADKRAHCVYCGAEYIADSYGCCHSCGGPQGRK